LGEKERKKAVGVVFELKAVLLQRKRVLTGGIRCLSFPGVEFDLKALSWEKSIPL